MIKRYLLLFCFLVTLTASGCGRKKADDSAGEVEMEFNSAEEEFAPMVAKKECEKYVKNYICMFYNYFAICDDELQYFMEYDDESDTVIYTEYDFEEYTEVLMDTAQRMYDHDRSVQEVIGNLEPQFYTASSKLHTCENSVASTKLSKIEDDNTFVYSVATENMDVLVEYDEESGKACIVDFL